MSHRTARIRRWDQVGASGYAASPSGVKQPIDPASASELRMVAAESLVRGSDQLHSLQHATITNAATQTHGSRVAALIDATYRRSPSHPGFSSAGSAVGASESS